ncbi:MAG: hypothetical protein H7X91_03500 [Burkholderiales bacterium]|nr:hypothetical protein [Burkholderiales bacterium]
MKIELDIPKAIAKFFTPSPASKKTDSHKIRKDEQNNYWTPRDAKVPNASRITLQFNNKKYRGNYQFDSGRLTVTCGEVISHLDGIEDHVEMRARELLLELARSGQLERFAKPDAALPETNANQNTWPTGRDT